MKNIIAILVTLTGIMSIQASAATAYPTMKVSVKCAPTKDVHSDYTSILSGDINLKMLRPDFFMAIGKVNVVLTDINGEVLNTDLEVQGYYSPGVLRLANSSTSSLGVRIVVDDSGLQTVEYLGNYYSSYCE